MTAPDQNERRRRKRWPISLACTVSFAGPEIQAEICDISLDGAMIRVPDQVPSEGGTVALRFRFRDEGIHLLGRVTSEVIHSRSEGSRETWIFGVRFESSMEVLWAKVFPTLELMLKDTGQEG